MHYQVFEVVILLRRPKFYNSILSGGCRVLGGADIGGAGGQTWSSAAPAAA